MWKFSDDDGRRRTDDDGRRRTDDDDGRTDDGRCAMTIAHLSLWLRWAKRRSYCTETTFSQTDRQMDRQPAMVKPVYLHNFVGGGIQTYFQCGKIVEKWPPGSQNFMGGVTFSRPVVQNLMLKFEPCQLLTLKNDPGSRFYRWKMTLGVIFQRGHYLMLHRAPTPWAARGLWRAEPTSTLAPGRPKTSFTSLPSEGPHAVRVSGESNPDLPIQSPARYLCATAT